MRAIVGTHMVEEARRRHGTSPLVTATLGRALLGAALLGSLGKGDETAQLRIQGNGPLAITAIGDTRGSARGFPTRSDLDLPLRAGKLDVPGAVGLGQLSVVRFAPGWREPYTGIVPLVSGEIAEDLALYLTESEQTPSAVALGVRIARDGSVEAAGGFLAQALPGAHEVALAQLEANVRKIGPTSERVLAGAGADDLLASLGEGLAPRVLSRDEARFHCGCDEGRVLRAVALLSRDELQEHVDRDEPVEVRCEFCGDTYAIEPERARALHADA